MKVPVMTVTASTTTTTTTSSVSTTNSSMSSTTTDPKLRKRPSTMSNRSTPSKAPLTAPTTPTPRVAQHPLLTGTTSSNPSLHPNVTSRSPRSVRKQRADTIASNVSELHIPSRPPSAADDIQRPSSATGSRVSMRSERTESRQSQYGATSPSPMFFRVGDVRSTKPTPKAPSLNHQPSHGKFFFANSMQNSSRNSSPPILSPRYSGTSSTGALGEPPSLSPSLPILPRPESRPGSVVGAPRSRPISLVSQTPSLAPSSFPEPRNHVKFVYANGTEEVLEPRGSIIGGGSEIGKGSDSSSVSPSPQVVPGSPDMTHFPYTASPTKSSPATSPNPSAMPQSPYNKTSPVQANSRRASLEGIVARHGRTLSISSIIDMADLLEEEAMLVTKSEVPETPAEKYARRSSSPPAIIPAAPVMSAKEKIAAMEEAAAKARGERKVLDLEISNASLLAINKSLERQLKKQTAELRRYRRLSRSGRLPVMPKRRKHSKAAGLGESEGYHVQEDSEFEAPEDEEVLSEGEDEDEEEEEEEEEEDSTGEEASEEKDTVLVDKRLTLDLTKHQELLDNSAKMNVSLKRCQFIADQLISDAKKALEYKIRPSDVHLGGRVLDQDAEETDIGTEAETEDDHEDQKETDESEDYDNDDDDDSEDDDDEYLGEMEEILLPDATGMGKPSTLYLPTPLVQTIDGYV